MLEGWRWPLYMYSSVLNALALIQDPSGVAYIATSLDQTRSTSWYVCFVKIKLLFHITNFLQRNIKKKVVFEKRENYIHAHKVISRRHSFLNQIEVCMLRDYPDSKVEVVYYTLAGNQAGDWLNHPSSQAHSSTLWRRPELYKRNLFWEIAIWKARWAKHVQIMHTGHVILVCLLIVNRETSNLNSFNF